MHNHIKGNIKGAIILKSMIRDPRLLDINVNKKACTRKPKGGNFKVPV